MILAEILKECTEEFREYDVGYIEQYCIPGEVHSDEISVDQDMVDADSRIVGKDTEDNSHNEGLIRYDIVFDAIAPKTGEIIRMIINIEVQADMNPGYPLITRVIYYLARLISRQKGTVFKNSDYGQIRKVYSIWICPDPSRKNRNSIAEYGFTQQKVIGQVDEPVQNYDKMKAIILNLNDEGMENRNDIIRLLSTLLSTDKSVEKRKQILNNDFHIPMTKEIEEGMQNMCNYGKAVENYGKEIGMQEGIRIGEERGYDKATIKSIRKFSNLMKLSSQEAMDLLEISKEDQERYAAMLASGQ